MADPAEIVAVELIGNLDNFNRTTRQSASDFGTDMQRIENSAAKAEKGVKTSLDKAGLSVKQLQQQSRNLGYQISDIGAQLSVGTSPFIVLAQQGSQVANSLEGARGVVGRFAGFLSGPWGAALLAATTILGSFIFKTKESAESVDDLVAKLKKQAQQARDTDSANAIFAKTLEGLTEAVVENEKALDALNKTGKTSAQVALENAEATKNGLIIKRAETEEIINQLEAQIALNRERNKVAGNDPRITGSLNAENDAAQETVNTLRRNLGSIDSLIAKTERQIREFGSRRAVELGSRSDEDIINDRYDAFVEGARRAAAASNTTQAALQKEVERINELRAAELERFRANARERKKEQSEANRNKGSLTTFISPVEGGTRTGKFNEQRGSRQHGGIDIAVPVGTNVKSAAGGTVITAGNLPGYGNVVIVDHGSGTTTRYAHLSKILAKKGDTVDQGDVIGLSGGARGAPGSGNSRGPHLHYEVRRGRRAVDPNSGPFPTDQIGAQAKTIEDLEREAQRELQRRQAFENELASLQDDEVKARQSLINSAEEIAALELQAIEISRARYDDNLKSLVEQKKLTDEEAGELRKINDERAKLRAELVKRREDERKFRMAEAELQRAARFDSEVRSDQADVLQNQLDLARTQEQRRDLEHRLLDLQFAEERARNDYLIAYYDRIKTQAGIAESEIAEAQAAAEIAELRNASLEERRAGSERRADQQTAGPLDTFFQDIPSTADEINEALESVAAGGLATFTDALTDAIVNFRSLGDVGRAVLQNLTAALVKMAIQQIILRTIGSTAGNAATAATGAQAATAAAAWAPAAALASLATLGANAGPASAALAATNALAQGLALTGALGRAQGGPIFGPGGPTDDKVAVAASNGEYMIKAASVRKLGRTALDHMNLTGSIPLAIGGPIGGAVVPANMPAALVGGGGGGGMSEDAFARLSNIVAEAARSMPPVQLFPTLDPGSAFEAGLNSPGGQRAFFDFVNENNGRFKSAINQ